MVSLAIFNYNGRQNMKKNEHSKDGQNKEVQGLRCRIAELEKYSQRYTEIEKKKARIEQSLRERIKELNCLYGVAELIERHRGSIDQILQGVADILPPSWQRPEITCGKVTFEDKEYITSNFKRSRWKQAADIFVGDTNMGTVEVYYLEKRPTADEGPFLSEERLLINAISERIGRAVERIRAEEQLEVERRTLKNKNIALVEILERVQIEKNDINARIQANVDKIIMPILFALGGEVPPEQRGYVRLLEKNLSEIAAPFINRISRDFSNLTPVEIQICNLIRNGFTTKEIAKTRRISPATVNRHREHIRKKLDISNKTVNLTTYLNSFSISM